VGASVSYRANASLESLAKPERVLHAGHGIAERSGAMLRDRAALHSPVAKPPPGAWAEWIGSRKRLPGELKRSWRVGDVVMIGGERFRIEAFTRDPVAPFVENDTQPHLILPRKPGGHLRFWDRHGAIQFAKLVHHPGTRGQHMMSTALTELAVHWHDIAREEVDRWAREALR
jgi:hypothetical protein